MDEKRLTVNVNRPSTQPQSVESTDAKRVVAGQTVKCQLMLESGGGLYKFELAPKSSPFFVGRQAKTTTQPRSIDLSPFKAHELGVSRIHAQFERTPDRVFVRDLDSTNGTWVNGQRLTPNYVQEIFHEDKIEFGRLATIFYIEDNRT